MLFTLIANGFQLVSPRVIKYAVDSIHEYSQQSTTLDTGILWKYVFIIIALSLGHGIFRFMSRWLVVRRSRIVEYELRNEFLQCLQMQSRAYFQNIRTGDLMTRATSDLGAIRQLLGPGINQPMNLLVVFTAGVIFMMTMNFRLTLLLLIPVPLGALLTYKLLDIIQKIYREVQEKFSEITTKVQENIAGMRVVKGYTQEDYEIDEFESLNREYIGLNIKRAQVHSSMWSSLFLLLGLGQVILLWFGGQDIINETLSIGDLVAFTVYIGILGWPIIALGWVLNIYKRGVASMIRLNEIFDAVPEIVDTTDKISADFEIKGEIEFKNVEFRYKENLPNVIKNMSFEIQPGQTVAFVGPTGSGKSSIVYLILRMFDTTEGQVLIDGIPIRDIPLHLLRQYIGFVSQEPFLFSESIRENIAFGALDGTTEANITEAAAQAEILEEINEFSDKLDTVLGERGINLSGGQKQRVAIARALIRQPRILILDDALSSVDTHTEERILSHLQEIMKTRTSIIISHRISTIRNADTIFVIDEGKIVESGRHEQLIRAGGLYSQLYQKQLLQDSLKDSE